MRINSLSIVISILVALVQGVTQFRKSRCIVHDPSTVQNISCSAKSINRTMTVVNISANVVRQVNDVSINIQIYSKAEINYRPFPVNVTENYCEFFSKNRAGAVFRLLSSFYLPFTNMNHTCPYLPGYVYIKDFRVYGDKVPPVWPHGSYRFDVLAFNKDQKFMTVEFYVETFERF